MKVETGLSRLPTWLKRDAGGARSSASGKAQSKTLGEVPPVVERLEEHPELAPLWSHYGILQKLRRKLRQLSGRDANILLARHTVGAADNRGNVYLGVEFLQNYGHNDALLAAVMAHEWGHLISQMAKQGNLDHLSWEEIYALRREEEASADAFCGRMLAMMGYAPDPICQFLRDADRGTPEVKYYAAPIREAIICEAHRRQGERAAVTRKIFPKRVYSNPYTSRTLLADD